MNPLLNALFALGGSGSIDEIYEKVLELENEVTGRTGDGGIDGKGIAKIHGFMSFHVITMEELEALIKRSQEWT